DGFTFEGRYRVAGPGFAPGGDWYADLHHREEAARGLSSGEDLWHAGRFAADLRAGEELAVVASAGDLAAPPPAAAEGVAAAARRARAAALAAGPDDDADRLPAVAADAHVVAGPTVVAGYPWFGEWSRDALTAYDGLFLETGRPEEGRALLLRSGALL